MTQDLPEFLAARQTVQNHLDALYSGGRERPRAQAYGFDTGDAWAPIVDWDGISGTYIWLADKANGALTPKSFPEFLAMPDPVPIGDWPADSEMLTGV